MSRFQLQKIAFLTGMLIMSSIVVSGCASAASATSPAPMSSGTYLNSDSRYGVELRLLEDGTYTTSSPSSLIPIRGTYLVQDDQIVFTETEDGHCTDIPGTYQWVDKGGSLSFTVVEDQCSLRRIALQSGPWVKQP